MLNLKETEIRLDKNETNNELIMYQKSSWNSTQTQIEQKLLDIWAGKSSLLPSNYSVNVIRNLCESNVYFKRLQSEIKIKKWIFCTITTQGCIQTEGFTGFQPPPLLSPNG
jgi:phage pi2 protein 07